MVNKYPKIDITVENLKKIMYFIIMFFRADSLHLQGASAKRDLIGASLDDLMK